MCLKRTFRRLIYRQAGESSIQISLY